jgi:hypothetical protein
MPSNMVVNKKHNVISKVVMLSFEAFDDGLLMVSFER